jgi:hypothetical protein
MPTLIRGDRLSPEVRDEVLRAYGYRWTVENEKLARAWLGFAGAPLPVSSATQTDAEWLAEHAFGVNKDGRLSARRHAAPATNSPDPQCACCGWTLRPQDSARQMPGTNTVRCDLCAHGWGDCCKARRTA